MPTQLNILKKHLWNNYNNSLPVISSWLQYLRACQECASERKQYTRAALIQDLIIEEINTF